MLRKACKNPIFVFGYPRSGTTLLRALLGAHSQIHLVNEPELFRGIRSEGLQLSDRLKPKDLRFLLKKMQKAGICGRHLSDIPADSLKNLENCTGELSIKELYEALLPARKTALWGEKSLGNVFYLDDIYDIYPNAIFIHIIRDPRAVLLSNYRKRHFESFNSDSAINRARIRFFVHGSKRWKQWFSAVESSQRRLPEESFIQTCFSNLVKDPGHELGKICTKIGVTMEDQMLDASNRMKDPVIAKDAHGAYAHQNLDKPIDARKAKSHEDLPLWASYIIDKYLRPDLSSLKIVGDARVTFLEKISVAFEIALSERRITHSILRDFAARTGDGVTFKA